jgi:hypothetical protein
MPKPSLKLVGEPRLKKGKVLHQVYIEYPLHGKLRWLKLYASHAMVAHESRFKDFIQRCIDRDVERVEAGDATS